MAKRQQQMEEMGISIKQQGIAIDTDKFYLVNLNEDPTMSEMLVYHLRVPTTRIGSQKEQDILLTGLAIEPQHAVVTIREGDVFIKPCTGATVYVNGVLITQEARLSYVFFSQSFVFG